MIRWTSWGSLLPGLGWVYGVATLWASRRFTYKDKIVGTLLFPGGWFGAWVAVWLIGRKSVGYCWKTSVGQVSSMHFVNDQGCVDPVLPPAIGLTMTGLVLAAAAIGPVYLRARARR
ncbi:MAG: hypothetical protein ABWZ91_17095 [Nocardioides sp.]